MRFFIALEIPEESKQEISNVQQLVKELVPSAHLTAVDKLHLTLAFIGEQPDNLKERLISIIAQAAKEIPPFEVTPAYIDGFPQLHTAHTLWVGVKGDIEKLMIIRERIKDQLVDLHLSVDERRYEPHIAIAKLRNFHISPEQEAKFQQIALQEFTPIKISSLKLFESVPEQGFHVHNTLAQINFS